MAFSVRQIFLDPRARAHYYAHMSALPTPDPAPSSRQDRVEVSQRIPLSSGFFLATEGELCVLSRSTVFGTVPLYHFTRDDAAGRYLAMVDLVRHHGLQATEVADAFSVHRATLHRMLNRFEEGGVRGLIPGKGRRMPTKIKDAVARRLVELKKQGASNREVAQRLGVSLRGVEHAVKRLVATGLKQQQTEQDEQHPLPTEALEEEVSEGVTEPATPGGVHGPESGAEQGGASSESMSGEADKASSPELTSSSVDLDPLNRQGDRLMAQLGLLYDAAPMFAPGVVPRAGVLLAVPVLIASGIFDIAPRVYGNIGPAFYGLRTSVLAFVLLALLRIKRPENLKGVAPKNLGRVLGLDRAPEMKTLRRKLRRLAAQGRALEFMRLLAQARAKGHGDDLAYLYIDGHVRVYSGQEKISKAYVMQRRLAMPGTTDYWVNDKNGQPLVVITAEANEGMTKMLLPVLKEIRAVIGSRRVTIVFDRGGWSPKLFKSLIDDNWDILTYRKGKTRRIPRGAFTEHKAVIEGRDVTYQLAERRVKLLGGKLKMRQVTMLGEDGYQTNILTNKDGVPRAEVAYYMFNRWRQENYFKYMEAEFALDALAEYGTEEAEPDRMVPNPKRKSIDKELKKARLVVAEFERKLGVAASENKEGKRRTVRGLKIATGGAIGKPLREAREKVQLIVERRKSIPTRVSISEALNEPPVRLRTESKRLTDTFKMVAYQAETTLVSLLQPHYARAEDEGRKLIVSALHSAAELKVSDGELRVRLEAQSSPHRTRAIAAVCRELNKIGACFPGTNLRLIYEVDGAEVSQRRRGVGQEV